MGPAASERGLPAPVSISPFDRFPELLCVHSERRGGVSDGPFRSLNLGFATGDDPARVRVNRIRWFEACGAPPGRVVAGRQVHGAAVRRARADAAGRDALDPSAHLPRTDGLWTDEGGRYLMALSADCPIVVLYEPERGVVAAVHAGWRGVAAGIIEGAVEAVVRAGAARGRLWAGVSPGIGPCCYTVGRDVVDRLRARLPAGAWMARDGGGFRVDLKGFAREALIAAGVRPGRIAVSARCSACEAEHLYSYRRDGGRTGRMTVLAGLRG